MAHYQLPARRVPPGLVLFVVGILALVLLLLSVKMDVDCSLVLYDEDVAGNKVCLQVETPRGVTSCESVPVAEQAKMEWVPRLSMPK